MSGATFAVLVGGGMAIATYLAKRLIDYVLPSNRRVTWLDRWTVERDNEEADDVD